MIITISGIMPMTGNQRTNMLGAHAGNYDFRVAAEYPKIVKVARAAYPPTIDSCLN
jgi:hypothetical protein